MSQFHLERFKCGNTDDKLFHVWIAEGKYESWWLCILRMVFGIFCHVLSLFWWFVNYKKGALDSQVIKFASCLPMVGGSLRALRLLPPLKLVTMK
jgi:hypothetical protein